MNIAKKIYPFPSYMPPMRSLILLSLTMLLFSTVALGQTNRASIEDLTTSALQSRRPTPLPDLSPTAFPWRWSRR